MNGAPAPVIHRDVTPPNILIGLNGVVKLSDFGLARAMDRARLTDPDVIKGKMAYLAPELTHGAEANAITDLYALGVTMWQALAGQKLFTGDTNAAIFLAARKAEIPSLEALRPDLPKTLVHTITRSLARDPAQRFASANAMRLELTQLLRNSPVTTDAKLMARAVYEARDTLGIMVPSQPPPPV